MIFPTDPLYLAALRNACQISRINRPQRGGNTTHNSIRQTEKLEERMTTTINYSVDMKEQ
jgi:hypothetical protein